MAKPYYCRPQLENVEDVEKYIPGGYHPVDIGDEIGPNGKRYEVLHKLGFSSFSTVWCVRSCLTNRYYALKILCADAPKTNELQIIERLRKDHANHENIVDSPESFKISGQNGEHQCFIHPLLWPSLRSFDIFRQMSGDLRHRLCQQVANGINFLHERGICHGSITMSNIVFELPDIQYNSPPELLKLLGDSMKFAQLKRSNGSFSEYGPRCVVQSPTSLSGLDRTKLSNIRIIDFGAAFLADQPPQSSSAPFRYFPPELCFGYPPSVKSDIWQLAFVLYQLHCESPLLPDISQQPSKIAIDTIVRALGKLPSAWKGRFDPKAYGSKKEGWEGTEKESSSWFGEGNDELLESSINSVFREATYIVPGDRGEFSQLLKSMLAYDPKTRPDAAEVLQRLKSIKLNPLTCRSHV
ncbi:kinase-like domain-containing protein [Nemania abortiva]|nr:kinase-like domain-containing protein [Nemania abortiva]